MNFFNRSCNISSLDRGIRFFLGTTLAAATAPGIPFFDDVALRYVVFIFALLNIFAALSGWCFGYALFGFSTNRTKCRVDGDDEIVHLDDPQALLQRPDDLRNTILALVFSLVSVGSIAYVSQLGKIAQELGHRKDLESFLVRIRFLSTHFDEEARTLDKQKIENLDQDLIAHITKESYLNKSLFWSPVFMRVKFN